LPCVISDSGDPRFDPRAVSWRDPDAVRTRHRRRVLDQPADCLWDPLPDTMWPTCKEWANSWWPPSCLAGPEQIRGLIEELDADAGVRAPHPDRA